MRTYPVSSHCPPNAIVGAREGFGGPLCIQFLWTSNGVGYELPLGRFHPESRIVNEVGHMAVGILRDAEKAGATITPDTVSEAFKNAKLIVKSWRS